MKPVKLTTRMPSLAAMDRAAKVCAALAERARRDGEDDRAQALRLAAAICAAKAMVSSVLLAHWRGYFRTRGEK